MPKDTTLEQIYKKLSNKQPIYPFIFNNKKYFPSILDINTDKLEMNSIKEQFYRMKKVSYKNN